jgi:hypothetical protein
LAKAYFESHFKKWAKAHSYSNFTKKERVNIAIQMHIQNNIRMG